MKKVLLLVAAVVCVSFAQAVSLYWTTPSTASWLSSVKSGALIYSATTESSEIASDTMGTIYALAKGTASTSGSYTKVASGTDGNNWTGGNGNFVNSWATLSDGQSKNTESGTYFIVLFNETGYAIAQVNATDTTNAWLTDVANNTTAPTAPVNATFKGTLVPEPTVLALLALGVAGLALRRRA